LDVFGSEYAHESTGCLDFGLDLDETRILVLDTSEPGLTAGRLSDAQLEWFKAELAAARGRPILVALHHAITALGVPTDFINLEEPERFIEAARAGGVRMVISGHVHMSTAGVVGGVPFTTIAGCHYNIFPQMGGDIATVPRFDGPGQLGNVLLGKDGIVVHHETFFDRHVRQPAPLHAWST